MATRNTRLLYKQLDRAEASYEQALEDKSQPVQGKSWTWWAGYREALRDAIDTVKGE